VASVKGGVDTVELLFVGEGVAANRPTKSRLGARKRKLHFDKKHKKLKKDLGTPKVEIDLYLLISPLRQRL
jgi:hypothetical protein